MKKMNNIYFHIILLVLLTGTAWSQETKETIAAQDDTLFLDLRKAITIALDNNPSIRIQRLDPLIAETFVMQEKSTYDPVLSAGGTRTESKTQRFLGAQRTAYELLSERAVYEASLSQNLPTGTNVSANYTLNSSISNIYTDQYTGNMNITVTQAILRGFGLGVNMADLRHARLDVDISDAEFKAVAEETVGNVENAYWSLYLAKRAIDIQHQSLELAEKQLQESIERVTVGRLPELELAAVHAEVSTRKSALIDAQSNYEQARLRFLYLLNPSVRNTWGIVPQPTDRPFIPVDTLDAVELHVEAGLEFRSDLRQAKYEIQQGELDITRTKNGLLPRLDFFISLGRSTYAESFDQSMPKLRSPYYDVNMGVNFEFPVPNRQARARLARAKWTHEQMEISLDNMKQLVEWDVRGAFVEVERARQQIGATTSTRELQSLKVDAELEKFRVGKSTNYLVLQAQREYTSSQLDEASAMVDYLNALVNLYQMEGTLLERRGIDYN